MAMELGKRENREMLRGEEAAANARGRKDLRTGLQVALHAGLRLPAANRLAPARPEAPHPVVQPAGVRTDAAQRHDLRVAESRLLGELARRAYSRLLAGVEQSVGKLQRQPFDGRAELLDHHDLP